MTEDGKGDAAASAYGWLEGHAKMNTDARWLLAEVERLTREVESAKDFSYRSHRDRAEAAEALVERLTGERASILSKHQSIIAGFEKAEELLGIKNAGLMDEVERLTAEVGRLSGLVAEADSYLADPSGNPIDAINLARGVLAALREDGEAETLHLEGCTLPGGHEGPCDGGEV